VASSAALDHAAFSSQARDRKSHGPDRLTGSFIQPFGESSAEHWQQTLADMKALGMDTVVVQFSRYGEQDLTANTEHILAAADQLGMTVMVGTMLDEHGDGPLGSWYLRQYMPWELKKDAKEVADYTTALVDKLKHHPSLGGIYIPYEVNATASAKQIGDFYGAIAKAAKEAKPDLSVMLSPYTNLIPGLAASRSPEALTRWWDTVLSRADIDILAWQDGVGGTEKQLARVERDLGAIAEATEKNGVELWANLETFHRKTKWYEGFSAEPASMETVRQQIEATRPYVTKLINFDFNDYMSPQKGEAERNFYEDYQRYLEGLETE
jgi:uncharacterized lipoprotein YddW (UPF0748 family)